MGVDVYSRHALLCQPQMKATESPSQELPQVKIAAMNQPNRESHRGLVSSAPSSAWWFPTQAVSVTLQNYPQVTVEAVQLGGASSHIGGV